MSEKSGLLDELAAESSLTVDQLAAMPAVREALAQIDADCRSEPRSYLDETAVPHGGE